MRRSVLVLVALAAVVLSACGGDDDDVSVAGSGDDVTSSSTTSDADQAVTSPPNEDPAPVEPGGGAQRVAPRPGMTDVRPQSFDTTETPPAATDGGVLVQFYGGVAPCFVLDHVDAVETSSSVTITLFAGSDPSSPDSVCIEIAALYEVFVALDAPLGDRAVIDGAARG